MARRHDDEDADEDPSADGKRSLLGRRTFLTVAGAGAFAGMTGATGRSRAAEVDLGAQGLSSGDDIDPYIEEHWTDGSSVYIPPGEYQTMMSWWDTDVSDATLRGDPAGVTLHRAESPPTWGGGGDNISGRMNFDGHVVVENLTFEGQLGQEKEKFDVTGGSDGAHLEIRNFNIPDGGMGCGDSQIGRARGDGRVTYKWCYFGPTANTAFYQTSSASSTGSIRQVFDGCTFHNNTQAWRGGTRDYTVVNCLYVVDGPSPDWSDSGGGDPNGSGCWGGGIRPFKMDQGFQFDGTVENLHFWITEPGYVNMLMDWQSDQPGTSGTMDGIFVYTEGNVDMGSWSTFDDWTMTNVHVTGGGAVSDLPPQATNVYTGSEAAGANGQTRVWSPDGQGLGYLTRPDTGDQPTPPDDGNDEPTDDEPTDDEPTDEPEGSVFEVISTSTDANLDYTFTVDGTVEPTRSDDGYSSVGESNDGIVDNGDGTMTVTGHTGGSYGDAYEVNSHVTSFERTAGDSDYRLRLDGQDVTDQFGSGDDADDEPTDDPAPRTFDILSTDDGQLDYRFVVEGTAEPTIGEYGAALDESEDQVADDGDGTVTVTGNTGNGYGDAFEVAGQIRSFEQTGGQAGYTLYLDGQDVTDQIAPGGSDGSDGDDGSDGGDSDDGDDGSGDSGPKRVVVDGTGAPEEVNEYRIEVTGDIQADPDNSSLVDGGLAWDALNDVVDDSTAIGVVGNGVDAYTFTGEVVSVDVEGNATAEVQD